MKIEGLLKILSTSCFLFSLHQGTLSILSFLRIQNYMLSLMNEINPCITFTTCFVCDTKQVFPKKKGLLPRMGPWSLYHV